MSVANAFRAPLDRELPDPTIRWGSSTTGARYRSAGGCASRRNTRPVCGYFYEFGAVAVTVDPDSAATAELLRLWCASRIRRECIPERWFLMDDIPKTGRGKLNRDQVRDACVQSS